MFQVIVFSKTVLSEKGLGTYFTNVISLPGVVGTEMAYFLTITEDKLSFAVKKYVFFRVGKHWTEREDNRYRRKETSC